MKQVQAVVCDSEYNVGTVFLFSVRNRHPAMITLNLGDSGVPAVCQCHSRSTVDLSVACCHVMST